ncbi:MAG: Mth938-like domain-containing protein [Chitinispirillaceae bacterium]|nr:Mth938-like domain-containing protein [Chitinispirillaceae bacterium]
MSWVFKHKLLTLFIITGAVYWFVNHSQRFGIVKEGFVVYNRIPVFFFDCYIDPDGGLHLEADLGLPSNVTYWFDNHFSVYDKKSSGLLPLLIGTGFDDSAEIAFSPDLIQRCRARGFEPRFSPSREATERYNALRGEGKTAAILLKVK